MAENENMVAEQPEPLEAPQTPEAPAEKKRGKAKEWLRKKIVALKRAPHMIPLACLAISTVYFMLVLYPISQAVYASNADSHTPATGICIFIATLLSLLVLVSFLNAFPKRKKPNIAFIVLVFVMIAGMIVCEMLYYTQMAACIEGINNKATSDMYAKVTPGQPYIIVHIVLLGISAVVFALLPLYKKLIMKIDTSVKLESATENMKGQIDIQED